MEKRNEIRIKLESEDIRSGKIEAKTLGNFLIDFQSVIDKFVFKLKHKERMAGEISSLYLERIEKGSVDLIFEGNPQMTLDEEVPVIRAYDTLRNLAAEINHSPDVARDRIKSMLSDPSDRLRLEIPLRNLMLSDFYIVLFDQDNKPSRLNENKSTRLQEWIEEDSKEGQREIRGVMLRIKGDEPSRYFTIQSEDGSIVRCYYEEDEEAKVLELFKKPLIVVGIAEKKRKSSSLKEMLDLQAWDHFSINQLGSLKFKTPVTCNVSFEDEIWCLGIETLGIYACGDTYREALTHLEGNILAVLELYTKEIPVENMSDSAKDLLSDLKRILGEQK